jgi:hypothetical protein
MAFLSPSLPPPPFPNVRALSPPQRGSLIEPRWALWPPITKLLQSGSGAGQVKPLRSEYSAHWRLSEGGWGAKQRHGQQREKVPAVSIFPIKIRLSSYRQHNTVKLEKGDRNYASTSLLRFNQNLYRASSISSGPTMQSHHE